MLTRIRRVEFAESPARLAAAIDAYEAKAYKVTRYRNGYKAVRHYFGAWWVHLLLLLATRGIGNIIYAFYHLRWGKRTDTVYLRLVTVEPVNVKQGSSRRSVPGIEDAVWRPVN